MKNFCISLILLSFLFQVDNVFGQSANWYHSKKTIDQPYNIGTDHVYQMVLSKRSGVPVVVAVIDSGVDIEHEDLREAIWTNADEIPNNGIDDDNNGYVDDINGWNFIGGKDGRQVHADTFEETRLYAKLDKKYGDIDEGDLNNDDIEEYRLYKKYKKTADSNKKKNKIKYEELKETEDLYIDVFNHLRAVANGRKLTPQISDSLQASYDRLSQIGANVMNYFYNELGEMPEINELYSLLLDPVTQGKKHFESRYKYNYNKEYNSRVIVGDDYSNVYETGYGNNLVEGPDAMHGTHVSGIIAAKRNNQIGINGICANAKIMVIRAVPDGDERDKDVANAIRYAVDNGASVINMSFGKGHSPRKEAVDEAVRYAEKNDVLLVHAAGNAGSNLEAIENFPNDFYKKPKGFLFWKKKQPSNWLSVGASSNQSGEDMVASFSNYGTSKVDLFAPGQFMYSTTPDNTYQVQQGTSFAAPVISGVAALLRSYFPSLKATQIKDVLLQSTRKLDVMVKQPGSDQLVPFSDLSVSGGIVDIEAALKLAAATKGKKKLKKEIKP